MKDLFGHDKVEEAIERIRTFEPPEGYYLAFSGGKDSVIIKKLAELSGVKFFPYCQLTTVDPYEVIIFIKHFNPDVKFIRPKYTMKQLIVKKQMPPTRLSRYCCEYLKEGRESTLDQTDKFIITGVRWAESLKRNQRKIMEHCFKGHGKKYLNPIIDWSDQDVWQAIKDLNIPYCSLYDEGFKRIGCIGCPLGSNQKKELERYPRIKRMYLKAFEEMLQNRKEHGKDDSNGNRTNAEGVMKWFIGEGSKQGDPDQTVMFE